MQFQAVFFDMDGLMFDTERLYGSLWLKYGPQFGIPITPQEIGLLRGRNAEDCRAVFLQRFGSDAPYDEILTAMHREFSERISRHLPVLPGLFEILSFLQAQKIFTAVVSSTNKASVERCLQLAKIRHYFDALICGDMVEHSKPEPDIYLLSAQTFGLSPARCLVLEDSYNGVRAGHAAGCFTIMIPNLDAPTHEMHCLANKILPSLIDVLAFLQQQSPESV